MQKHNFYFVAVMSIIFAISFLPQFNPNSTTSTPSSTPGQEESLENTCHLIAGLSSEIMRARQSGVPMTDAMNVVNDIEIEQVKKLTRSIVIQAYKENIWSTEKYKQRAINEFSNSLYLECLEYTDID